MLDCTVCASQAASVIKQKLCQHLKGSAIDFQVIVL